MSHTLMKISISILAGFNLNMTVLNNFIYIYKIIMHKTDTILHSLVENTELFRFIK